MSYITDQEKQHSDLIGSTFDLWDRGVYSATKRDLIIDKSRESLDRLIASEKPLASSESEMTDDEIIDLIDMPDDVDDFPY